MKVQFLLEFGDELIGVGKFKKCEIVDTYHNTEVYGSGYDIIEVEVDGIWEIKYRDCNGNVWMASDTLDEKDRNGCYHITLWEPYEEAI